MTETLPLWISIPAAMLLVFSGFITLTGSLGLLRLSNFYRRIHAPTLGNTMGVFCVLVASILIASTIEQRVIVHQVLITVFLVITSPVTAMLLMRAAIKRDVRATQKAFEEGALAESQTHADTDADTHA